MCLNEYHSKSERLVKIKTVGMPKGILVIDTDTTLLAQIELLNKKLVEISLGKTNVSHVQTLRCDMCGREHENIRFSLEGSNEEVQFSDFQKNNPYSNPYNPGWKDHSNFHWGNNQNSSANTGMQQGQQALIQRKPS